MASERGKEEDFLAGGLKEIHMKIGKMFIQIGINNNKHCVSINNKRVIHVIKGDAWDTTATVGSLHNRSVEPLSQASLSKNIQSVYIVIIIVTC